jgi:hypothetical protein
MIDRSTDLTSRLLAQGALDKVLEGDGDFGYRTVTGRVACDG